MAQITDVKLSIRHDHDKKLAHVQVDCKLLFSDLELCLMKSCAKTRLFKLRCKLWGEDSWLTGADDYLYTMNEVYFFPDPTPGTSESRTFKVTAGEGLLDEDWGRDEVYARVYLSNYLSQTSISRKSNVVSHRF
ncbi:MAG: hypothetical protein R6W31_00915 [Bacteroidales bacterium]